MKNVIFKDCNPYDASGGASVDMVDFFGAQLKTNLNKMGFEDFDICNLVHLTPENIKNNIKGVGGFVILSRDGEQFSRSFPNNTIVVQPDYDIENICKHIIYILTNFGREEKDMSNVFVTSDTHFYHGNIIRYCNRPFSSVEEMNEKLIENWNSVVGPNDKVIHLGDFCFGNKTKVKEVFSKLNGKIDLVMGNHDRHKIKDYYEIGFHRVYDKSILIHNFVILSHAPLQWIKDGDVYLNVYGHVHNMEIYNTWTKNTCCACVERHDYKPIPMDRILNHFKHENEQD